MKLNLCCSDQNIPGFVGIDSWTPPWATDENFIKADLRHSWPFADGSVEFVRAHDAIEHMPDRVHTMNEIHRVLKPGGIVEIVVPTTEGRGAWQDPTHVSYWNRNSFFYFTAGDPHYERFHEAYGIRGAFDVMGEQFERIADGVTKLAITLRRSDGKISVSHPVRATVPQTVGLATETRTVEAGKFAFSILHTSARPGVWLDVYHAWLAAAVHPEQTEYVLCIDERWGFDKAEGDAHAEAVARGMRPQDKVIWNTGRRCYVDGVNLAAEASSGDVLIVNADDQYPCDKWDAELAIHSLAPLNDFVIEVSTGTPRERERGIIVMPILSRERYERFGWVFFPQYESMYADNDFTAMAKRDGVIIDARHLMFPHKHWINKQREADEQDAAQNRPEAYALGERLFKARQAINFSGAPSLDESAAEVAERMNIQNGLPMIAICTPGNVFGMEWVNAYADLILHVSRKYNLAKLMGYTSDAGIVRTDMLKRLLNAPCAIDYVLWIDDDNTITVEQFEMLKADLDSHPEYDSVSAWTWCGNDGEPEQRTATMSCGQVKGLEVNERGDDIKFCHTAALLPKDLQESASDLVEIGYSGFPAVLMRFSLLQKAGTFPFSPFIDERCPHGKSGEDLAFFARTKIRSGARYAVDRRVYVPHYKRRAIEPAVVMQARREQAMEAMMV